VINDTPHDRYRRQFLDQLLESRPDSVLDVGCGGGGLIRELTERGCRTAGIEFDRAKVDEATKAGLNVQTGRGEALPFAANSFDAVTFQFVTHHLENLDQGLREAMRVARKAVFVLDGWHDVTVESHRVAADFDAWSKAIDRQTGMIHNECPSPAALIAPLSGAEGISLQYGLHLYLRPLTVESIRSAGQAQLARIADDGMAARRLGEILRRAEKHGVSDDGAVILVARKP
jgi:SAM-dependent methyltransferase